METPIATLEVVVYAYTSLLAVHCLKVPVNGMVDGVVRSRPGRFRMIKPCNEQAPVPVRRISITRLSACLFAMVIVLTTSAAVFITVYSYSIALLLIVDTST